MKTAKHLCREIAAGTLFNLAFIFLFVAGPASQPVSAQLALEDIDSSQVKYKTIYDLLNFQKQRGFHYFSQLTPSCYQAGDSMSFSVHTKAYRFNKSLEEVWNGYKTANPAHSWDGKMVKFGFIYSKLSDHVYYATDEYKGAEPGQIIFINLRILNGVRNLGVAFEVTKIDEEAKIIEFCYLNNGKSEGTQTLRFESPEPGVTLVHHDTRYRSESAFRDHWIYPKFHTVCIDEFHGNVKKWIDGQSN